MLSLILFVYIGLKLDMLHGLYLALVIIDIVMYIITFICKLVKLVIDIKFNE